MDLAIPRGLIRKSRFPHWFSHALITVFEKRIILIGDTRKVRISINTINLSTAVSLLKLQLSLKDLIGIRT
jgi:hypothetical protein